MAYKDSKFISSLSGLPFGQSAPRGPVTIGRIRPEYDDYINQKRNLELTSQKKLLGLFDQLLGGGISGGLGDGGNPFSDAISKIEASRTAKLEEGNTNALNSALARLEDRGLGGSSFAGNQIQGSERNLQAGLNDLSGDIGELQIKGIQAGQQQQLDQLKILSQLLGGFF